MTVMNKTPKPHTHKESGIVSIVVTMILMIIISLIVLGFARIVRREQRQALDRQLSTQAFYAAEAGVNEAIRVLNDPGPPPFSTNKTNCGVLNPWFPNGSNDIDSTAGVKYTCLLINQTPESLEYDTVDQKRSLVIPIKSGAAGNLTEVTLQWQDTDGGTGLNCPALTAFPPAGSWESSGACDAGVLRVDLAPIGGPAFNRNDLRGRNLTAFLKPVTNGGAGTLAYNTAIGFGSPPNPGAFAGSGGQGSIVQAACSSAPTPGNKVCSVTINVSSAGSGYFVMRVKSIYKDNTLRITAKNASGPVTLVGAQAVIDSTGKAFDVLRRIQVRVPIGKSNIFPEGLESVTTLCKRMSVAPNIAIFDAADPACNP